MNKEVRKPRAILLDLYGIVFNYHAMLKKSGLKDNKGRRICWFNEDQREFIAKYGMNK